MKWLPRRLFLDLFVLSPAMEALGELSVFFVLHGQQQFTWSVRLFVSQMLDINLDGIKEIILNHHINNISHIGPILILLLHVVSNKVTICGVDNFNI